MCDSADCEEGRKRISENCSVSMNHCKTMHSHIIRVGLEQKSALNDWLWGYHLKSGLLPFMPNNIALAITIKPHRPTIFSFSQWTTDLPHIMIIGYRTVKTIQFNRAILWNFTFNLYSYSAQWRIYRGGAAGPHPKKSTMCFMPLKKLECSKAQIARESMKSPESFQGP